MDAVHVVGRELPGDFADSPSTAAAADILRARAAGIRDDHECESLLGMEERLRQGVYVMLRQGTVCHDLNNLVNAGKVQDVNIIIKADTEGSAEAMKANIEKHGLVLKTAGDKDEPIAIVAVLAGSWSVPLEFENARWVVAKS